MEGLDVTDPGAVGDALVAWVTRELDPTAGLAEPPEVVSGGFDSHLHGVRLRGEGLPDPWRRPLVVRVIADPDRVEQAEREVAVQRWAAARGYATPDVLAVFGAEAPFGRPAQVMGRLPGTTSAAALSSKPWRSGREIDRLAGLARRLHALPTDGWPGPTAPEALAEQRLALPRRIVGLVDDADLAAALRRVEALDPASLQVSRPVVCHGDFHPLNVMVDGDRSWVLDWTDAGLGPPEADVARTRLLLALVAPLIASRSWERAILARVGPRLAARYQRAYLAEAPVPLAPDRLRRWEALHALHGWSQVVALHAGAFAGTSSSDGRAEEVPLGLVDGLRAEVHAALDEVG